MAPNHISLPSGDERQKLLLPCHNGAMSPLETDYEINTDPARGTVWVNGFDGSCIGRFSKRFGIDVHRTSTAQLAGEGQCLVCTHGPADHATWLLFVEAMRQHHGVDVPQGLLTWT